MKHFKLGILGVLALFLITSCEVDPIDTGGGGGTTEEGPTLALVDQAGSLSADSKVAPGEIFTVTLDAGIGDSPLNALTIEQDGNRIDDFANRLTIAGTVAPSSAILVPDDFKSGFTWDITIRAQEDNSKSIYNFIVEDENGNTASRDIEIDTEVTGSGQVEPSIVVNGNTNVVVPVDVLNGFPLTVLAGNSNLDLIAVLDENLDPIDASRIFLGEVVSSDQFTENPTTLSADDAQGFTKTIYIRSQSDQSEQTYTIVVQDLAEEIGTVDVVINTFPNGISGNDLVLREGVLLNRAGPAGTGGIDLDSGAGTGSSDAAAELKDNGIDAGNLATNWLQRISPANNAELRQLIPNSNGLSESFTFDAVTTDSQLADIWDNATPLVEQNSDLEPMTGFVTVGDMYIVQRDGNYYIAVITEIFIDPASNDDFYRMNIKS